MEDLQCVQVLVPLRHLALNWDVFGPCRCLGAGYGDGEFPFLETIFLDAWDINGTKDWAKAKKLKKPSGHQGIVKNEPVTRTSTSCSDCPWDGVPCDSAI
jgi:hypothetical protein